MIANPFARDFDSMAHAAFAGAGMAGMASFTPQRGSSIPACRVFVDRDVVSAAFGGAGVVRSGALSGVEAIKNQAVIGVLKEDVPDSPKNGDQLRVDGETFIVQRRLKDDESQWVLLCQA